MKLKSKITILTVFVLLFALAISVSAFLTPAPEYEIVPLAASKVKPDDVWIEIDFSNLTNVRNPKELNVIWHNDSDEQITFGLYYTLKYSNTNGEFTLVESTLYEVQEIAVVLMPGESGTQSYSLLPFKKALRPGEYCLELEYYGISGTGGTLTAHFTIKEADDSKGGTAA